MRVKELFKQYDIRGIYNKELTNDFAYNLGMAVGNYMKNKKINEVLIARDVRPHSGVLKKNLIKGILEQGKNVLDIGIATTPMFYFCVMKTKSKLGIMITASHNPIDFNGFKFVGENAKNIGFREGLNQIMKIMLNNYKNKHEKKIRVAKGKVKRKNLLNSYENFLLEKIEKKPRFLIVIDPGNMVGSIEANILKKKCKIRIINDNIGIKPRRSLNPLEKNSLKAAQLAVKKYKAKLGVVLDGDADRIVCIDEKGRPIKPDILACLLIDYLVKKKDKVVYSLNQSMIVKETIRNKGAEAIISKVGRTNISAKLSKVKGKFGCEKSGHYFYKEFNYLDSAVLTIIHLLNILNEKRKNISSSIKKYKKYYSTPEVVLDISDEKRKSEIMRKVKKAYSKRKYIRMLKLDGLTYYFNTFWFNVRKSNTQNQIKYFIEAVSKEKLKKEEKKLLKIIKNGT